MKENEEQAASLLLYQVHHGMPKNKQLMKLLEKAEIRRLHEKIENNMLTELRKEEGRELREELFFAIDERNHDAHLTDKGCAAMSPDDPETYVLPDMIETYAKIDGDESLSEEERSRRKAEQQEVFAERGEKIHNVDQLIRAYCLYENDVDYVVQDNQVIIVDENTGRPMPGRRWSDGLHQAVEAKEGVKIEKETQTLATITIQNYFRMYDKLAGMTGTAETEATEFSDIYGLDVVVIPTNRPVRRVDYNDLMFMTQRAKYKALLEEIEECHGRGQPILVGTVSVEASELISRMLRRKNIPHNVLNAKFHEREAEVVARAGQPGGVTIATNMAGRGTDIKLGEGVVHVDREVLQGQTALGDRVNGSGSLKDLLLEKPSGLHVIATERHESRRIDRQLRGRCARQGDPGSSRFYISIEDDLMRLYGAERMSNLMSKMGMEEGDVLESRILNRSIETAQRRVEQENYARRKRTLEYDDVMNQQREIVYGFRNEILRSDNVREHIYDVISDLALEHAEAVQTIHTDADADTDEDAERLAAFLQWAESTFPVGVSRNRLRAAISDPQMMADIVCEDVRKSYEMKVAAEEPESLMDLERHIVLHAIDSLWQEYLRSIDGLKEGVYLRAHGQKDPLVEFKREAFNMFEELMSNIKQETASNIFRSSTSIEAMERFLEQLHGAQTLVHEDVSAFGPAAEVAVEGRRRREQAEQNQVSEAIEALTPITRETPKVGRNDPCPCGSGKKYKKCCGSA